MIIKVRTEVARLNNAIAAYRRYSDLQIGDIIKKQGAKFSYFLGEELKTISPVRGSIRARRLAEFARGVGTKVRATVQERIYAKYGVSTRLSDRRLGMGKKARVTNSKGLNIQNLLVKGELNTRERGIGFLSVSARFSKKTLSTGTKFTKGRSGARISRVDVNESKYAAMASFVWGEEGVLSDAAAVGMLTTAAQERVFYALDATTRDIMAYVERKQTEGIQKADL